MNRYTNSATMKYLNLSRELMFDPYQPEKSRSRSGSRQRQQISQSDRLLEGLELDELGMNIMRRLYPNSPIKMVSPSPAKTDQPSRGKSTKNSQQRPPNHDSNIAIQMYDSQRSDELVTKLTMQYEDPQNGTGKKTKNLSSHKKPPKVSEIKSNGERSPLTQDDGQSLAYSISALGEEIPASELVSKVD